jgi:uncharacterized NAD(P)/FAD-binding protein YdhS/DNA-binding Lrp family transcriptional regulator
MSSVAPSAAVAIGRPPTIAIIGAGFSGTLLALHLLRRCPGSVRIHLIERRPRFGRGLAYSTANLNHVLNVPTSRMSAFHDRPDDFLDWLRADGRANAGVVTPHCFVAREVFGDYVRHHLKEEFPRAAGRGGRLLLTRGEVLDLRVERSGVTIEIERHRRAEADIAVLAIGNFPPEPPPIADRRFYDSDRYRPDPWAPEALAELDPADPVLLIGTGLTMVDTAVSLLDRGHTGKIHALSRRGLLPRRHTPTSVPAAPLLDRPLPTEAAGLTRALREEIAELVFRGGDWRSVIDGLRPTTQDLWHMMPAAERARFVRHLRPWWDVHRHRIAPEIADRIDWTIDSGQLTCGATRIRAMRVAEDGVVVTHRPRRATADQQLIVERVINCSGPACDYERIADPLIRHLLDRGDIRPGPPSARSRCQHAVRVAQPSWGDLAAALRGRSRHPAGVLGGDLGARYSPPMRNAGGLSQHARGVAADHGRCRRRTPGRACGQGVPHRPYGESASRRSADLGRIAVAMDEIDRKLLQLLQDDATLSIAQLAECVGLSATPCWKRIQKLEGKGVVTRRVALVDPQQVGVGMAVFVEVEAGAHTPEWLERFSIGAAAMPEVMALYRMAGDIDYLLQVAIADMAANGIGLVRRAKRSSVRDLSNDAFAPGAVVRDATIELRDSTHTLVDRKFGLMLAAPQLTGIIDRHRCRNDPLR